MPSTETVTVSRRVHDSLRRQILTGELAPGDRLPSERVLAEEFGVNRHAVREALKRLQQAGLVRITHGGATRVLDWRDGGGLEVLLDLAGHKTEPLPEIVRSLLEMRASVGADSARLCAERGSEKERRQIEELGESTAGLVGSRDTGTLVQDYTAFWLAIVAGSGNLAYRLSLNSLIAAMNSFDHIPEQALPDDAEGIRRLARAIGAGDPSGAEGAAQQVLRADIERIR
jgi:DNA-binding FadR family transcriptional regulator